MNNKHTIKSIRLVLIEKKVSDFIDILSLSPPDIMLLDKVYGEYRADLKCVCPKSSIPLHKRRRHVIKLEQLKDKYVGTFIKEAKITGIFYGPDKGYKNRSFYFYYIGQCGHEGIASYALLTRHKKDFYCVSCTKVTHGERSKENGALKKRTATYIFWMRKKDSLPEKYKDFFTFRTEIGDKPYKRADLHIIDNKPYWINLSITEDYELNLMVTALRQAFRYSNFYKSALDSAKVETEAGTKYRCNICKELYILSKVQVDHIEPIVPIEGPPLAKQNMLSRVWTDNIQVLDKSCHAKKSAEENKQRKHRKKVNKNER